MTRERIIRCIEAAVFTVTILRIVTLFTGHFIPEPGWRFLFEFLLGWPVVRSARRYVMEE